MKGQLICTLHRDVSCSARGYGTHECKLDEKAEFATCEYSMQAIVPMVAEPEESPDNVVQQEKVSTSENSE